MRKYVYTLISVLLAMFLLLPAATAGSLDGTLVILFTNDIHGHAVADTEDGYMGFAEVAQYKADAAELGASVLLLDAGDPIMGMPDRQSGQGNQRHHVHEPFRLRRYDAWQP